MPFSPPLISRSLRLVSLRAGGGLGDLDARLARRRVDLQRVDRDVCRIVDDDRIVRRVADRAAVARIVAESADRDRRRPCYP